MTNGEKYDYLIESVEHEIALLKSDRKTLNRKLMKNKQQIASMQNTLRKLKDERRRENE